MGNGSPSGLLLGKVDNSYAVNVRGTHANIVFKGREVEKEEDGGMSESWVMIYKAGMSNCGFGLTIRKTLEYYPPMAMTRLTDNKLDIEIVDFVQGFNDHFRVNVQRDEAGLLFHTTTLTKMNFYIAANVTTTTTNAYGDITETSFDMYGSGPKRGLMIRRWKRKSKNQNPYTGTIVHYYVNVEKGEDVGLSVAVKKIRVLQNGLFDFAVDGPEHHPVASLACMFNEVLRTGTWEQTQCPHCASKFFGNKSETESDTDNSFSASSPSHGHNRNGGSLVSNGGNFRGRDMGNTYIHNLYHGGKGKRNG